ncbi:MAG: 16S rRNA (guanine(527)-N(7))-methyltransferase RsmG [Deltaproteobacteria bacterium]|nr:MAG: 16S rRNA (guanine(527)-N(7))-methyltransferase RsmG [Deltaproteobacteria bacterium]
MYEDEIRVLREKSLEYGIALSEEQLGLFQIYLDELCAWNRRMNLTGLSHRQRMVFELFLDSLVPVPHLAETGRLLDVGSGAGFPGIPLKICKPQLNAHLLEASAKKVSFLKQIVRLLSLEETEVIRGRIEKDRKILHPDGYHLITARALAPMGQTIRWCAPLLRPGSLLVSFMGGGFEDELKENRQVIKDHDLAIYKKISYTLPGRESKRATIILEKKASRTLSIRRGVEP